MGADTAISVKHWIFTDSPTEFPDLEGVDDFRREPADDYISLVKGRLAGAGVQPIFLSRSSPFFRCRIGRVSCSMELLTI